MRLYRLLLVTFLAAALPAAAHSQTKKMITQDAYDDWRSIQGASLSSDGRWALYSISPLVGEGVLVVRNTQTGAEYRHMRGYTGRAPTSGGGSEEGGAPAGPGGPVGQFTPDSRHVVFMVQPSQEEVEKARATRARGAAVPRNSLAFMDLADGKVTLVPRVRSVSVPREGRHITYVLEPVTPEPAARGDTTGRAGAAAATPGGQPRPIAGDSAQRQSERRRTYGNTVVVRDMTNGSEVRLEDVLSSSFNDDGSWLAYTVASRTPERDGVYLRNLANGTDQPVMTGLGNYRSLSFDRDGNQIVFVSDRDEYTKDQPRFTLYHATVRSPRAQVLVTSDLMKDGLRVADRGSVSFTRAGNAVLFPIASPPLDSIPADSLADKAVFDLWHYRDPYLQSQQRLSAGRDRNRTYTGIYHFASKKFVQLTNDSITSVSLSDDAKIGVSSTNVPYLVESMWGDGGTDVYLLDPATGTRRQVREKARGGASMSPTAKFLTWFEDGNWTAYHVASGKTVNMTEGITGIRFDQETHSTPSTPGAWGNAGWTKNDQTFLVYDRYDIWELDPMGAKAPRNITESYGRKNGIVFRIVNLDREDRFIDPAEPLMLRAVDEETKASGFWTDRIGGSTPPSRIVMMDKAMGTPQKARNAEQYLLTQSTFAEFPDLWTGPSLDRLTKISNANPQQSEYRWGTAELVSWLTSDGVPTRGILYKPEDFDPSKKYPLMVYFYETHTNGLHGYSTPTGRNVINAPVYVSKGYLVFMPDIVYTDGYPGPSALKTIVPGVQHLIARGFVDPKGVGIQGQSWGGYQTAYIITQSNLFSAAMAGAPVANMTSAYGGIRWESGNSRTSQYERGQSRIGGDPWTFPTRYIENSPLFYADRIRTPLFIMHNDEDGAVPWYQGIEMFIAMRRLGKEVYMINYNGDAHNPRKRANQRDMDLRMQQFFDHHLTGAPMPQWMKEGIPFLQKGRDQIAQPVTPVSNGTGTGRTGG